MSKRGWWGLTCFNGLSREQQHRLVMHGNLPFGYQPDGDCPNGAEVEVTTMHDLRPGPRFYCVGCAVEYLQTLNPEEEWADLDLRRSGGTADTSA